MLERFNIGAVFSEISQLHSKFVMDSIGHPIAALKEAEPQSKLAEDWWHWVIVKAGHMYGLPT